MRVVPRLAPTPRASRQSARRCESTAVGCVRTAGGSSRGRDPLLAPPGPTKLPRVGSGVLQGITGPRARARDFGAEGDARSIPRDLRGFSRVGHGKLLEFPVDRATGSGKRSQYEPRRGTIRAFAVQQRTHRWEAAAALGDPLRVLPLLLFAALCLLLQSLVGSH